MISFSLIILFIWEQMMALTSVFQDLFTLTEMIELKISIERSSTSADQCSWNASIPMNTTYQIQLKMKLHFRDSSLPQILIIDITWVLSFTLDIQLLKTKDFMRMRQEKQKRIQTLKEEALSLTCTPMRSTNGIQFSLMKKASKLFT